MGCAALAPGRCEPHALWRMQHILHETDEADEADEAADMRVSSQLSRTEISVGRIRCVPLKGCEFTLQGSRLGPVDAMCVVIITCIRPDPVREDRLFRLNGAGSNPFPVRNSAATSAKVTFFQAKVQTTLYVQ